MESLKASMKTALEHHESGRFEQAERLYRDILRVDPRHDDALHLLGVAALQQRNHITAVDLIGQAIDVNSSCGLYHSNLGACYTALGQFDRAIASLRRAVELDPELAAAHCHLGTALTLAGDEAGAIRALSDALRLDPHQADAATLLARLHIARNRPSEAVECYRKLVEARPDSAEARCDLADAYRRNGQYHEAIEEYRAALRQKPDFAKAYHHLGLTLQQFEEWQGAAACFSKVLELQPNDVDAHQRMARLLELHQEFDDAIAYYRRAIELSPDDLDLQSRLASALVRADRWAEADGLYADILTTAPEHPRACFGLADLRMAQSRLEEAARLYETAISACPDQPGGWSNLGSVRAALGDAAAAVSCFERALELRSDDPQLYYNLANGCAELDRLEEAVDHYRRALMLRPDFAEAHNNLGTILMQQSKAAEAESCFREAIRIQPDHAGAHANLGQALRHLDRLDESIVAFRRAIEIDPDHAKAHFALACSLERKGKLSEAVESYRAAVRLDPEHARTYHYLGNALKECGDYEAAVSSYQRALELVPGATKVRYQLGNAYRAQRKFDCAIACYKQVLEQDPNDPSALISLGNLLREQDNLAGASDSYRRLLSLVDHNPLWDLWIATLCPKVFYSTVGIDDYRQRLEKDLKKIARANVTVEPKDITSRGCPPPYQLQFHGCDDRPLKEAYARVFRQCLVPAEPKAGSAKPRIGLVVTNGHEGVFLRFMQHVLERIDPQLFDLEIVCSAAGKARIRKQFHSETIRMRTYPSRFDRAVETIRDARYDVLYYWEIGSDVTNYFLPFFRLAPVQCTSGGLPVTSGIPQVDYFLSSDIAEPPGAQQHYSEKLILAKSLLTFQERLRLPATSLSRDEFGFQPHQHLYICPHKIEKFHPDIDPLLAGILRRDPAGIVVIPEDSEGHAARKLRQRFTISLSDVGDRVVFVPYQPFDRYLCLTAMADVLLDPVHYGGGLTAYDGFSFNRPIVTMPGEFVRGRYPFAFYRKMQFEECVADSADEYVEIAVRLGTDTDYRQYVVDEIRTRSDVLFGDVQSVREHERIFAELVQTARSSKGSG